MGLHLRCQNEVTHGVRRRCAHDDMRARWITLKKKKFRVSLHFALQMKSDDYFHLFTCPLFCNAKEIEILSPATKTKETKTTDKTND